MKTIRFIPFYGKQESFYLQLSFLSSALILALHGANGRMWSLAWYNMHQIKGQNREQCFYNAEKAFLKAKELDPTIASVYQNLALIYRITNCEKKSGEVLKVLDGLIGETGEE